MSDYAERIVPGAPNSESTWVEQTGIGPIRNDNIYKSISIHHVFL